MASATVAAPQVMIWLPSLAYLPASISIVPPAATERPAGEVKVIAVEVMLKANCANPTLPSKVV